MSGKIDKEAALSAIRACTEMEHSWYNGTNPGSGFSASVSRMRHIFEGLLELDLCCNNKEDKKDK